MLELKGVRRRNAGVPVLDGVTLSLSADSPVALLGAAETARPALARLLAGQDRPDAGAAVLDGVGVIRARRNRSGRAVILVAAPWVKPSSSTVRRVLQGASGSRQNVAELSGLAGLDAVLDRKVRDIEPGQRARLAVACARARKPDLIVLDSPAAGTPAADRESLLADICDLLSGLDAVIVWVASDPGEAAALGGRTIVLENGHVVQDGPAAMVAANPQTIGAARALVAPTLNTLALAMEGETGRLADGSTLLLPTHVGLPATGPCTLAFRPEDLTPDRRCSDAMRFVVRMLAESEPGDSGYVQAAFADAIWLMRAPETARGSGLLVNAYIDPARLMAFGPDGRTLAGRTQD